jgi:hypothetical protein
MEQESCQNLSVISGTTMKDVYPPSYVIPTVTPIVENAPPKLIARNIYGLLTKLEYKYCEDGSIDWRKMIPSEYLVPNKLKTSENDISKLEDKDLIILLGGIKYLAQLRGFKDVSYKISYVAHGMVVISCTITWIPNYETEGREISFTSLAGASFENTNDFGKNYLPEIAENRAFCRCVRNFLKINIVSKEELGDNNSFNGAAKVPLKEANILKDLMIKKNISFETLKKKLVTEEVPDADTFTSVEGFPTPLILDLIERLKKFKKAD